MNMGKKYDWSYQEKPVTKAIATPEELEDWLNEEVSYYLKFSSGFYTNCIILGTKKDNQDVFYYVHLIKGRFPPLYSLEEKTELDLTEMEKERACINWDGDWTTIAPEDFPVQVTELIYTLTPQKPFVSWLFS